MNRKEKRRQQKLDRAILGKPGGKTEGNAGQVAPAYTPPPKFTPAVAPTIPIPSSAIKAEGPPPVDIRQATTMAESGRFREARNLCQQLRARSPADPAVLNLSAMIEFHLGDPKQSLVFLKMAVQQYPLFFDAHSNMGNVYQEMGNPKEAEKAYRRAVEINPAFVNGHCNLGAILQERNKHQDAIAAYRRALATEPDHFGALSNLASALKETEAFDEAADIYRRAIALKPGEAELHANLGDIFIRLGRPREALDVCDQFLATDPTHPRMLAFKAIALNELGDDDAVRGLVDFDNFVARRTLGAIPDFDDLADFNAALADHVINHPSLTVAPASHATRLGKHSGELLVEPKGPIAALESEINRAVTDYAAALPQNHAQPFVGSLPATWKLHIWGVYLEGQGYQEAHIHPSARLSGVYYVKVPQLVQADDGQRAGWICFGRPSRRYHYTQEPTPHFIQPEEGLMLLFPPYFWHETVPFTSDESRLSIAFDILA